MRIDWLVLVAAIVAVITSHLVLLRIIIAKKREIARLMSSGQQMNGELLRARSEHAKELAELKAESASRTTSLQGNVRDLAALLKEHGASGWEGWQKKQLR